MRAFQSMASGCSPTTSAATPEAGQFGDEVSVRMGRAPIPTTYGGHQTLLRTRCYTLMLGSFQDSPMYILGEDDDELKRLRFQHVVWNCETKRLLRRAGFSLGQTLLDVGCGPGLTTLDLHEIVGDKGRVIGVDASSRMIATLNSKIASRGISNVRAIVRDVGNLDELYHFDGAFSRWVLCFVEDPASVVRTITRTLKSGGRFVLMEYFNYTAVTLEPESALFQRVSLAIFESFRNPGGGLEVGRRLPGLMESAGMQVESVAPICAVGRPGTGIWNWFAGFYRTYLPKLVQRGLLSQSELNDFSHFWEEVSSRSDALIFAPPMLGIVGVKI